MLQIPSEGDFLQSHNHHAGSRADDEHGASHTSAVGKQQPEKPVDAHVTGRSDGIHAHASSHERHVVDNARDDTDGACDKIVVAARHIVERSTERGEHADFRKARHSHEYSEEEKDG